VSIAKISFNSNIIQLSSQIDESLVIIIISSIPSRSDEMISPYFTAKKPPTTSPLATFSQGSASKPRVPVSGLLKRRGGGSSGKKDFDAKQPSLLQMWAKKTP
jgi:hypothetical protein